MLHALVLCALAPLLVAGAASARTGGGTPAVFVSVEGSSQLVGVDLTTGRVVARVPVPRGPQDLTSYGARYLLVVSPRARAVTLVSAITVDHYHGRRLWVADREAGAVLALASQDGRVLRRLRGCPGARGVTVVGTAWVAAACDNADYVAFWSQRDWKRRLVRVGGEPHGVAEVVLP